MTLYDGTAEVGEAPGISTLPSSLGEEQAAHFGELFAGSPSTQGTRARELGGALANQEDLGSQISRLQAGEDLNGVLANPKTTPEVPIETARAQVKQSGLSINLPDQDSVPQGALDIMLARARAERQRQTTIARGPGGVLQGALDVGTSLFLPALDPLMAASFAVPVLGEARYGKMLADAGSSFLPRAALGVAVGAEKGAIGAALLAPLEAYAKTQEGQDYHFSDALETMIWSAGTMGLLHGGGGELGRLFSRPNVAGTHVTADHLASDGLRTEELPGLAPSGGEPPLEPGSTPESVIGSLPVEAKGDVLRGSIAALAEDKPVQAAEHIAAAAEQDPHIAESLSGVDAFHGSPHDFDQFDSSKIGEGEGAQSYGHGLYFAENETVAKGYAERLGKIESTAQFYLKRHPGDPQAALAEWHDAIAKSTAKLTDLEKQDLDRVSDDIMKGGAGNVYKVHIAADREHFLDWDKPLSEQSEHVQTRARALLEQHAKPEAKEIIKQRGVETLAGKEVHDAIAFRGAKGPFAEQDRLSASTALHQAGIPGIKYLDQGSRPTPAIPPKIIDALKSVGNLGFDTAREALSGLREDLRDGRDIRKAWDLDRPEDAEAVKTIENYLAGPRGTHPEEQTHNLVVFDDKLIRITHKNGKEVGLDEMKAARTPSGAPIDASHDIVSGANSSREPNGPVYIDKHIPQFSALLKDKDGNPANLWKYLSIHEETEAKAMRGGMSYDAAHTKVATPAERAAVEADGVDWKEYTDEIDGYLDHIEHEHPTNAPPAGSLHVDPNKADADHHRSSSKEPPTAGDNVVHVRARKTSGPRARPETTRSLFEHIAANGGLRDDDPMIPDVRSSLGRDNHFVPGFGNLIRKPGQVSTAAARSGARAPMSLDTARESAVEAGYLEDQGEHTGGQSTSTVRHLLDAIDTEARGNRVYRNGAEPPKSARDQAQHEHELNNAMDKALGDYGVDLDRIPSKTRDRTLEIMDKEGVTDPLDAYERAVMEETEHGAQAGEHERIPETIPGWDVADDAGAAPGAGGAPEAGGERAAGGAARDAGQGDRAAGRAGAATAFRRLAGALAEHEEPAAIEAARAAERMPEPASIEHENPEGEPTAQAESAAEKADRESAEAWKAIEPYLSEADRAKFGDTLAKIDAESADYQKIVREGAACLAAAVA